MKKILTILILSTLLTSCKSLVINKEILDEKDEIVGEIEKSKEEKLDEELYRYIENMTLEEKIGQLLVLGFEGKEMSESLENKIEKYKPGGLIFFSRNISDLENTRKLVSDIREYNEKVNDIPLFLSIDEEGGLVSRLSPIFGELESMESLGQSNDLEKTRNFGRLLGMRLSALGLNLDYAPVLDINSNKDNPVIGSRALGDKRELVGDNGIELMKGLNDEDVLHCVKHFPGHGDTRVDSHFDLPVIDKDLDHLRELELYPFERAIESEVDMIMVGHILFPKLDEENPASLSKNIINDLLRGELGYDGLVTSDDLTMGGILNYYDIEEAVVKFLLAGGDMPLVCHEEDTEKIFSRIKDGIENKELEESDLNQKIYRILKLKSKYDLRIDREMDLNEMNRVRENL